MIPPLPNEYPASMENYVSCVRHSDPFTLLREQVSRLDQSCRNMADESARHRYASGKWSVKEVIGHITDTERIFSCRLLRIARGDSTPLPGFDQDPYVAAGVFDDRSVDGLVLEFGAVRAATLTLIESLPDDAWAREGTASNFRLTARALLYIIPGHVAHHFELLAERYGVEGLRR